MTARPLHLPLFLVAALLGCSDSPRTQEQVRHDTAAATRTLTSDLKGAALGIKDGLKSAPREAAVNINTATRPQLEALPGLTPAMANQIIAHRPYASPSELRKRHLLPKDIYDRNQSRLITGN